MSLSRMSSLFKSTLKNKTFSAWDVERFSTIGGAVSSVLLTFIGELLEEKINNLHSYHSNESQHYAHEKAQQSALRSSFSPR